MSRLRTKEANLLSKKSSILQPGSATYGHFRNSRRFNPADITEVMHIADKALEIAIATRVFKDRQGITNEELEEGRIQQNLRPTAIGQNCIPLPTCPLIPDKYRRIDGACNNIAHPTWGAPFTAYSRLLPPNYQDGIWSPRVSVVDEEPLPSPRLISTTIISDIDSPNHDYTLLVMQFGQFISHDFTQSMDMSYANGSAISCCDLEGTSILPPESTHYACMPIPLPHEDQFYGTFKQKCMNFVRSALAPSHDCTLGYSEQMNKLTHFLDASSVYGSTPEQTRELRSFHGGTLKVFDDFGRELLPLSKDPLACLTMEQGSACFESGDTRTNQMVTLVVMHTLFLREHNRLARSLQALNPLWTDEKLFLEARQILIAEMQVIIYKEFLPTVLGEEAIREFGLGLGYEKEYSLDYNPAINPSITNEFATAAFRFGHSTVDGQLRLYGPTKMEESIAIPEVMFYPSRMRHQKFLDEILSTLTTEPIQDVDPFMPEALTRYMFRGGNPFGVDLASINIQRGRDHGLRSYNDYRELTGLPRLKDFAEFGPEIAEKLYKVYRSVDDLDLWVGGLLESKAPGSLVGPTFRDIIADQFARLKKGDRYFFENGPSINPGYFSPDQLKELRKASISRIICDNSDGILLSRQAPKAFRKPGVPGNEFSDCNGPEIPSLDLSFWQA
ncbi:chorion peroxidase-like [Sitophilus oryzae]|uniref:Chorion peroxidase-like n=2 Tax=Sitophilus oryzae TaxID=7048 RepID=A0A6J2X6P6_SITOR|nr:chorion peroxidase-like [Sitophilus oryzae]